MPLYTYKCLLCNEVFEVSQSFQENSLEKCNDKICQLNMYIGSNHIYTHLRENRGLGILKKQISNFNIKIGDSNAN